jgi:3-isopropylmalate dehydrogenase
MALRWSLGEAEKADRLFAAVNAALDGGARTRDLCGSLTTREMGDAVLAALA